MNTNTTKLTVTYFPYTYLDDNDLKRLIFYFDIIRLLQIFPDSDPGLPDLLRRSQLVQLFYPISDPALLQTVRKAHQAYHQLGSVHQNSGLVELHRTFALQEDFDDSRPGLVAQIRKAHLRLSPEEIELINDAVFILLAAQLDRDHLELDRQLERIHGLETKFHKEVGIGTDEERDVMAMKSPLLQESDPPRTQYPLQRLRAWTRLYRLQQETTPFLPLTTSAEVLGEISERLPSQLAAFTESLPAMPLKLHSLAILPDPQLLPLEKILEFRRSLKDESVLDKWRRSIFAAVNQLQQEPLEEGRWQELEQNLQQTAAEFPKRWPTSEIPPRYLRLECLCYPKMYPEVAFSLAAGLEVSTNELHSPKGSNGIILLLSPSQLPLGDKQ